ncbi:MAG: 2-C-methyl-D-erythritol 2,4-cyclodiphosphate synthase [Deinococcales bacterium]|jgi:2-C-methyl-D-erythritol 2,4-cyclodiphosphate synthase
MDGLRIGYGEDAHALAPGRPLVIGAVTVAGSPLGTVAHSDGDVLLHALSDALLAACAMGDIGQYFPPSNPNYRGLDSRVILQTVLQRLADQVGEFSILNLSAVVILDQPRLGPTRRDIQRQVAGELGIDVSRVGVTFKTSEGMTPDFIQARATVLLRTE